MVTVVRYLSCLCPTPRIRISHPFNQMFFAVASSTSSASENFFNSVTVRFSYSLQLLSVKHTLNEFTGVVNDSINDGSLKDHNFGYLKQFRGPAECVTSVEDSTSFCYANKFTNIQRR